MFGPRRASLVAFTIFTSASAVVWGDAPAGAPDAARGPAGGGGLIAYEVTITNTTKGQPFSPPLLVTHAPSAHLWRIGENASAALRSLAEEGETAPLVKALERKATDVRDAGKDHLMPGKSVTLTVRARPGDVLSAACMLAATNDGFTGLDSSPLPEKELKSVTQAVAYDAGTEQNTEAAADVPYPHTGKGHVPTDPPKPVIGHPGITGKGDLGKEIYGWTNTVANFTIRRVTTDK